MEQSVDQEQPETPSARSLALPCATVFIASFCIMVLELVASRLVARHLGSSLYTWTSVIALIQVAQGRLAESVTTYREALAYNQQADRRQDVHLMHLSLGSALKRLGRTDEAREHLNLALEVLLRDAESKPESLAALELLGDTYAAAGRWEEAGRTFARALALEPTNIANYLKMSQSLELLGRVKEALAVVDQAIAIVVRYGGQEEVEELRIYRQTIEARQARGPR